MSDNRFHNALSSVLLIAAVLNLTTGCYYYRVNTKTSVVPEDIRWEDFNQKYFILHDRDSVWHLDNIRVDTNLLTGNVSALPPDHQMFRVTDPDLANRYRNNTQEKSVLSEVHLYTSATINDDGSAVSIDFPSLEKMEIYYFDKSKTLASFVVPSIMIPVAVGGIILLIWALTKESCPYIYVLDDGEFILAGEIFSGAIYRSLERDDYLRLPGKVSTDGKYCLKIANKLPEVQYINLSELWLVRHNENTEVLADRHGVLHTLESPQPAARAVSAGGSDLSGIVTTIDEKYFLFQEEPEATGDSLARNSVVMTFNLSPGTDSAKLVVRAKNSWWGDYIVGEFTELFGRKYDNWVEKQGKKPPDPHLQWKLDQPLPLMIYIETERGWQFADYFDLAGPLAFREMVMPLGLKDALRISREGNEQVRIKMETGFMFWELDYAALDASEDLATEKLVIRPSSAVDETGNEVLSNLIDDDQHYEVQQMTGNETVVDFKCPLPEMTSTTTLILHTKGYYTHLRNYEGPPDRKELMTFSNPGRLSQLSLQRFLEAKTSWSSYYKGKE